MTTEVFLAILPGLILVAVGLVGAGVLLPGTIKSWREGRERKKAIKVDRWIEGDAKVTLRDVEKTADVFGEVHRAELNSGTEHNMALITAAAAAIAYARKEAE